MNTTAQRFSQSEPCCQLNLIQSNQQLASCAQRDSDRSSSDVRRNSTYAERLHMPGSMYRAEALAELAHSRTFFYEDRERPDLGIDDDLEDDAEDDIEAGVTLRLAAASILLVLHHFLAL